MLRTWVQVEYHTHPGQSTAISLLNAAGASTTARATYPFTSNFFLSSLVQTVEGKDWVSHNLDRCHELETPVFLVLHIINYLMESV